MDQQGSSPPPDIEQSARVVGALLLTAPDPWLGAQALERYLLAPNGRTGRALTDTGVRPEQVADFRALIPTTREGIAAACQLGAAWEAGRRSIPSDGRWAPVATWVGETRTFEHRTAETLISLIIRARYRIRLFAPFVDSHGLGTIAGALAAATARGVTITVSARAGTGDVFESAVVPVICKTGNRSRLQIVELAAGDNFPHLKVLTIDGEAAYVGSANLTWAALVHNVELGVLVDGSSVRALDQLLDEMSHLA